MRISQSVVHLALDCPALDPPSDARTRERRVIGCIVTIQVRDVGPRVQIQVAALATAHQMEDLVRRVEHEVGQVEGPDRIVRAAQVALDGHERVETRSVIYRCVCVSLRGHDWRVLQSSTHAVVRFGFGAGDHLGKQPEDDELRAHDHQQDAEGQERARADRMAQKPHDREIGIDDGPEHQGADAEPAEEVERPARVLRQKKDGQQVEESAREAGAAELRTTVAPRPMADLDLDHAKPAKMRQRGDVAVQISIDLDLFDRPLAGTLSVRN